jgi:hypothetical protein
VNVQRGIDASKKWGETGERMGSEGGEKTWELSWRARIKLRALR